MVADRGVVCFSAAWSDPVIWALYSDKHRGVCLGFEIPEIVGSARDDEVMRVRYERKRLPFPNNYLELSSEEWPVIVQTVLSTKFDNWKYEEEIRWWVRLKEHEGHPQFLDFDESLQLKEVVLGAKCGLPKSEILRALELSAKDVEVLKAHPADNAFKMIKDEQF
jgi:hypothetical protein